ncbi:acyltransferase [Clostridium perfringens]|nr:acyltransferase [Clostridium perfringens]
MNKIKRIIGLFFINNIFKGTRFWRIKRILLKFSGIEVGRNTKVVAPISIGTVANICIGDDCWIGTDLKIYGNGSVFIDNNCDIAPNVTFITGSHLIGDRNRRAGKGLEYSITLKKGCWIGAKATLMGNIKINEGVVIGACSLVNKNIESNIVVAGNPAKLIRKL